MSTMMLNGREFSQHCEMIEATSLNRPDPAWRYTDPAGHVHQWFRDGAPAISYSPGSRYELPTLDLVEDPPIYVDDGDGFVDELSQSHYECSQCRAEVVPGTKADDCKQWIAGLQYFAIDGRTVSRQEFEREAARELAKLRGSHP